MTLVDSTVWIDFIRGEKNLQAGALGNLLAEDEIVYLNSMVLTEVLRGSRSEGELRQVSRAFQSMPFLELESPRDHIEAANLYRDARRSGVTVKGLADLLIAATCIKFGVTLLHNDRDFDNLASVTDLKVWRPPA